MLLVQSMGIQFINRKQTFKDLFPFDDETDQKSRSLSKRVREPRLCQNITKYIQSSQLTLKFYKDYATDYVIRSPMLLVQSIAIYIPFQKEKLKRLKSCSLLKTKQIKRVGLSL